MTKISTIICRDLKNQEVCLLNNIKKIKVDGSRPRILHGLCKVCKAITDVCPPFRPILSATGTTS